MTIKELKEARAAKKAEGLALIKTAEDAKRSLTKEEDARCDALATEVTSLDQQIEAAEKNESRANLFRSGSAPALPRGPEVDTEKEARDDIVLIPDPQKYSLLRAINQLGDRRPIDGYEAECSQEIGRRSGRKSRGFFMPLALSMRADRKASEQRVFDTTAGASLIPTILATGRLIDALRAVPVISKLGAQVISDVVGELDIPRMTSNHTYSWAGESAVGSESTPSDDVVSLRAKTLNVWYRVTRRMRNQTSVDIENKLRMNATMMMALGIDGTAIGGSGSGNVPLGLLNNTSIPTVALGTNGAAPTWASMVALESNINDANAQAQNMAYLTSQVGRGKLKTVTRVNNAQVGDFLWRDDNTINGYQAVSTTLMPKTLSKGSTSGTLTGMLYGNFASLIIALWGNVDVIVDPYTQVAGDLKVTMLQDADFNVEHPESFSKIVDMVYA